MISIGSQRIGKGSEPFVIAELSGNHNGSLSRALEIVEKVAMTGAHAIKIQTYTADTMTLDINEREFVINDPNSIWQGKSLYQLYHEAHTPWEWHEPIFKRANELGLLAFSTPFDESSVEFLEDLEVPCYKIASFENVDIPLIKKVAATGKPMLLSTGMASLAELDEVVTAARNSGCSDLILLKCTSTYPSSPKNSNVITVPHLRDLFNVEVGISDHTLGIGVALGAVAFGATVIEKHVTLKRSDGGVDSSFSMEPYELKNLVEESKRVWQSIGNVSYGTSGNESKSKIFRRSLYICEDLHAGDKLTPHNLRRIRPGKGLAPKYYDTLLGKRVCQDIPKGTPVSWKLFK